LNFVLILSTIQRFKTFNNKRNKSFYWRCRCRIRSGIGSDHEARNRTEGQYRSVASRLRSGTVKGL